MRCKYCLGDDATDIEYRGFNKDGVPVRIFFHERCWNKVQSRVMDMIVRGELDFKEEEK